MAEVTGAAVLSALSGSTTVSTPLGDAAVAASQTLSGGPVIGVGTQNVDALLASYSFRLPVAAPVKAPYVPAAAALVFSADAAAAGKYSIRASAPGKLPQDKPADISTGVDLMLNFSFTP